MAPAPLATGRGQGTHPGGRSDRRAPGHRGRPRRGGGTGHGWHSDTSCGNVCRRSPWGSLREAGPLERPPRHAPMPVQMLQGPPVPGTGAGSGPGPRGRAGGPGGSQQPEDSASQTGRGPGADKGTTRTGQTQDEPRIWPSALAGLSPQRLWSGERPGAQSQAHSPAYAWDMHKDLTPMSCV